MIIDGNLLLGVVSTFLCLLGIGQIVTGAMIINGSSSYFSGAIFTGLMSFITGFRGSFPFNAYFGEHSSFWMVVLSFLSTVCAVVGSILQSIDYYFVNSLELCVVNDSITDYAGNANTFYVTAMKQCLKKNPSQFSCTCVDSSQSCYGFSSITTTSCTNLINTLPDISKASFGLNIACAVMSALLCLLSFFAWQYPTVINTLPEDHNIQPSLSPPKSVHQYQMTSPNHQHFDFTNIETQETLEQQQQPVETTMISDKNNVYTV